MFNIPTAVNTASCSTDNFEMFILKIMRAYESHRLPISLPHTATLSKEVPFSHFGDDAEPVPGPLPQFPDQLLQGRGWPDVAVAVSENVGALHDQLQPLQAPEVTEGEHVPLWCLAVKSTGHERNSC